MHVNFEAMQDAMNDELFLSDLREVMDDFGNVDAADGLLPAGEEEWR